MSNLTLDDGQVLTSGLNSGPQIQFRRKQFYLLRAKLIFSNYSYKLLTISFPRSFIMIDVLESSNLTPTIFSVIFSDASHYCHRNNDPRVSQ